MIDIFCLISTMCATTVSTTYFSHASCRLASDIEPQPSVAPTALAAALVAQAANPSSPLVASMQAAAPVVTSFAATASTAAAYQCADGSWQASSLWYVSKVRST